MSYAKNRRAASGPNGQQPPSVVFVRGYFVCGN
jgi:hypothetical protein